MCGGSVELAFSLVAMIAVVVIVVAFIVSCRIRVYLFCKLEIFAISHIRNKTFSPITFWSNQIKNVYNCSKYHKILLQNRVDHAQRIGPTA